MDGLAEVGGRLHEGVDWWFKRAGLGMRADMLTRMTERDWTVALEVFRGCLSRRGDKGRDDLLFLRAMRHFSVHNITWRALPAEHGRWNSVWKRFSRLSRSGRAIQF